MIGFIASTDFIRPTDCMPSIGFFKTPAGAGFKPARESRASRRRIGDGMNS
jgi:hypothetical protein